MDDFGARERVRAATDIVDLIGRYMTLRRQGRNFVGLCPWHDDSRPSLQVNPERQSWKCWVCNVGGDCFSFVMQMDKLSFPEALQRLADNAGIPLYNDHPAHSSYSTYPHRSNTGSPNAPNLDPMSSEGNASPNSVRAPRGNERTELFRIATWVEELYHRFLLESPEADPARRYLTERGISAESIERFRLGYAPESWNFLTQQAKGDTNRLRRNLIRLGLMVQPDEGRRPYDRFRGRVIFPIHDTSGRSIALGGRVLPESGSKSPAKYINSPESPLFRKSKELYGLDWARDGIRSAKSVLIMEGYTDVVMAHQYGCTNAVAVLGTALNEQHLRILKRYTERIDLVLDGDAAGQRRAAEVMEYLLAANVDARIATLPDNLDPAEYLIAHGGDAFREMLRQNTLEALDHAYRLATRDVDPEDIHATMRAVDTVLELLSKISPKNSTMQNRLLEEKTLQRLAFLFHVSEQNLRARLRELRREQKRKREFRRLEREAPTTDSASNPSEIPPFEDGEDIGTAKNTRYTGNTIYPENTENTSSAKSAKQPSEPELVFTESDLHPDVSQRELLEILVAQPTLLPRIRAVVWSWQLNSALCRAIYEKACSLWDEGIQPDYARLTLVFTQPQIQSILVDTAVMAEQKGLKDLPHTEEVLREWLDRFSKRALEQQQEADLATLRQPTGAAVLELPVPDVAEQLRILQAITERKQTLEKYSPYAEEDERLFRERKEDRRVKRIGPPSETDLSAISYSRPTTDSSSLSSASSAPSAFAAHSDETAFAAEVENLGETNLGEMDSGETNSDQNAEDRSEPEPYTEFLTLGEDFLDDPDDALDDE